jgi:hypothetical protein
VCNVAKRTGSAGAVTNFYWDDRVFALADAVDKVDVVSAEAKVFWFFAEL